MAFCDDSSHDCARWSYAKLMREIRSFSNQERFSPSAGDIAEIARLHHETRNNTVTTSDATEAAYKEASRIYRETWLNPLLDELERRLVKRK